MRRRKKGHSTAAAGSGEPAAKKPKVFMPGDLVLCPLDFGVYWPGYIKTTDGKRVLVGFFDEEEGSRKPCSKVIPYFSNKAQHLLTSSKKKLMGKKKFLVEKFLKDIDRAENGVPPSVNDSEIIPSQDELPNIAYKDPENGDENYSGMDFELLNNKNESTTQDTENGVPPSDHDSEIIPSRAKLQHKGPGEGDEYDPDMVQEDAERNANESTTQDTENGVPPSDHDSEIIPSRAKLQHKGPGEGDEYDPDMVQEDAESDANESTTQDTENGVPPSDHDSEIIPSRAKLQHKGPGEGDEYDPDMVQEDAESDANESTTQDKENGVPPSDHDSEIIPSQAKLQHVADKGPEDGDEDDLDMVQEDAKSDNNESTTQDTENGSPPSVKDSEIIPSQDELPNIAYKDPENGDENDPGMDFELLNNDKNESTTQDTENGVPPSDDDFEIIPSQARLQHVADKGPEDGDEYDPDMDLEDAESDENESTTLDTENGVPSDDDSEIIPSQAKLQHVADKGPEDGDKYDPDMDQEDAENDENESTTQDTENGVPSDDDSEIIPSQAKLQHVADKGPEDGDEYDPDMDLEDAESDENESTTLDTENGVPSDDDSEIIPSQAKLQHVADKGPEDGDKYDPDMDQEDAENDENESTTQDTENGVPSDDDSEIIPSQAKLQHVADKGPEDGDEYDPDMDLEDPESDENESTTLDTENGVPSDDDSEIIPSQAKLQHVADKGPEDGDEYDPDMDLEDAESDENESTTQDTENGVPSDDDSEIIPSQAKLQHVADKGPGEGDEYDPNMDQEDAESDENESTTLDTERVSDGDETRHLNESYLSDITNPRVFTKRYLKNQNTNSKSGRTYDRRQSCYFCGQLRTNIQSHYEHAHKNLQQVKEMHELKLKIDATTEEEKKHHKSMLKKKQTILRNKGNDVHNTEVCKRKKGEIILSRRKNSATFDSSKYGPCPYCREWILFALFNQHKRTCVAVDSEDAFEKTGTVIQGKILKGQITTKPSRLMAREVFPSMKQDQQTDVAQNDDLILAVGELWLMKNFGNRLRRKNFTSFRMRLCARLLLLLRETCGTQDSMKEYLAPNYFDSVVSCALKACNLNQDEELQNPSVAIKLGYDVARLASAKLAFSIKQSDENGKREATDFLKLLHLEWSVKVSKTARTLLEERHFNKARLLPIPDDIVQLASYLVQQLKTIDLTPEQFREVVVLTETRLLLYNRRRPGELESITVDAYKNRSKTLDETETALRNLTKVEKTLIDNQDLIEIRGKTGRGVPLLVPSETRKTLKFLSNPKIREKAGVKEENKFLFANTGSTVVRAGSALNEVKTRLPLKDPNRILATNLRKHTATIAQVMSLNDQEMKNLCRHLGHTQKVHDQFYRQTSGLVERIDIAKLMLVQEYNLTSKYAGKKMEEIQLDEIFDEIAFSDPEVADAETGEHNPERVPDVLTVSEEDAFMFEPERKKATRVRWDAAEEKELREYLPEYFKKAPLRSCPTQAECKLAIQRSAAAKGKLCKRGWETIKKKVNNMLKH